LIYLQGLQDAAQIAGVIWAANKPKRA
jgi:hypothetical protein